MTARRVPAGPKRVAFCVVLALIGGCDKEAETGGGVSGEKIYSYVGADGHKVFVNDPGRIPAKLRSRAVIVAGQPGPEIYSYVGADGQSVYVNDKNRIPQSMRKRAVVIDLAKIELNSELAASMAKVVDQEYESTLSSEYCQESMSATRLGWLRRMWQVNGYLLVLGAAALFMLLMTPTMMRRFSPRAWGKVLSVGLPALLFAGVFSFATVQTGRRHRQLMSDAKPCQHDGFDSSAGNPKATQQRAGSVVEVRKRIVQAHQAHQAKLDRVMNLEH